MKRLLVLILLGFGLLCSCEGPDHTAIILNKWKKGNIYVFNLDNENYGSKRWNYQVDSVTYELEWLGHSFNITEYEARNKR